MQTRRNLIALLCLFLLLIIAGNIGKAIGLNQAAEKQKQEVKISDSFSEDTVINFLDAFYTFDKTGDNFEQYLPYLTGHKASKEQLLLEKLDTRPQQFGHVRFKSSDNYIQIVSEENIEVISFVDVTMDLLNDEEQIVTKGIENQLVLKLNYVFHQASNQYLIDSWDQMNLN